MSLAKPTRNFYPEKITRAGQYLGERLEECGVPVMTQFEFFHIIWRMYQNATNQKLYLRHSVPTKNDYARLRTSLRRAGIIGADRDYGGRIIRVLTISDLPAEEIVCLVDPVTYVSHLSAMQRWGLTDRKPEALILTRPNRETANAQIQEYMNARIDEGEPNPFPLRVISHPAQVRRRRIHVYETKSWGAFIQNRGSHVRLSTIGQTFLDMLQNPELCGGMSHVLEVWENHAKNYLDEIVRAVNTARSALVKSRAGYIIEERLELDHPGVDPWKALGQRGSSRKLDPTKEFSSTFSETWMISLNV